MTSAVFCQDGNALTGGANGFLYQWSGRNCIKSVQLNNSYAAIQTMNIINDKLVCGCSDSKLRIFNREWKKVVTHKLPATPIAFDRKEKDGIFVIGCANGSVLEVIGCV
jgi:hypothetical protein